MMYRKPPDQFVQVNIGFIVVDFFDGSHWKVQYYVERVQELMNKIENDSIPYMDFAKKKKSESHYIMEML